MTYPLVIQKQTSGWQYKVVQALNGGLNTSARDEVIPDSDLLQCDGVVIKKQRLEIDTGYHDFGSTVLGTPQLDFQFFRRDGSSELVLITTESVYTYAPSHTQWQYLASATHTTTNNTASAGATSIPVASNSGFSNGDKIGITLDDGSQYQGTCTGTTTGHITISPGIPVGRSVINGAQVRKAVILAGDLDHQVSITQVPSNDWLVFTNGLDAPMYYDGASVQSVPNLPNSLTTCKAVAVYNACLFLLNTEESGTEFPQRIRRSDSGNPAEWASGIAGFDDLLDSADVILGAEIMGPYLIVYRERSIVRGSFVNTAGITYNWETTVVGEGAVSTQSIVDLNEQHLIFCNAGVYAYTGGYDLDSVGDKVFYQIYSSEGDLDTDNKVRTFAFYVEELDEAWFFYPSLNPDAPIVLLRFNVGDGSWSRRVFADPFVGYGFYQTLTARRWIDMVGSWAVQTSRWNSRSASAGSPTTHLMSSAVNMVMEYDYSQATDNGTPVQVQIVTKDFFEADYSVRFDALDLYMKGTDILVEYSTDSGATYNTLGTVTSTALQVFTFYSQQICDKIRIRISTNSQGFQFNWLGLSYRYESPYRSVS